MLPAGYGMSALTLPPSIEYLASDISMTSLQVFFEGNVQGVGFRWTVRDIAKGFDVTGWARNLVDGRVEMQVSGEEAEVRAFVDAVMKSELRGHIHKHSEHNLEQPVAARGFEIRHD